MVRPLTVLLAWNGVALAQILTLEDPLETQQPLLAGKSLYDWATPKNSVFWKADSDGNEWRKDSYGTLWKREAGSDPFKKESWAIDGYDFRQTRRISSDTLIQFQLNLDGSIKPESVRRLTWTFPSDPSPSTLPSYLRKVELRESAQGGAQLQRQVPQAVVPRVPPK